MGEENRDEKREVLLNAIKKGITEVEGLIGIAAEGLYKCAADLRVEQSEEVFQNLSRGMKSLNAIVDFITHVDKGIDQLNEMGMSISKEPLKKWGESLNIFEDMLSAFESNDWVTVCDLIQYEIDPLLKDGQQGLKELLFELEKAG
ncbi:MAG: hypothetical protein GXO97_07275 [Nitrospirae bacterium]|nr:hypothetical protein [Nitrospirota bacterium]